MSRRFGMAISLLWIVILASCANSLRQLFQQSRLSSHYPRWKNFRIASDTITDKELITSATSTATSSIAVSNAESNRVWKSSKAFPSNPENGKKFSNNWGRPNNNTMNNSQSKQNPFRKSSNAMSQALELTEPMLYIKYRVPRVVTESKRMLLIQQGTFKRIFDATNPNSGRSNSGGGGYSSGGSSNSPRGGARSSSSLPMGASPADVRSPPTVRRRVGANAASAKRKPNSEEEQRRRSSSAAKSGSSNRRSSSNELELDDDGNRVFDDDDDEYEDSDVYLAVDEDEIMELSDVDDAELLQLINDEVELDQIMDILETQYGISTSFKALKARLAEVREDFTRNRRTGKTRRDRKKKMIAKYTDSETIANKNKVILPNDATISIKQLSDAMDLSTGEILKYLMVNEGMLININQNIPREMAVKVLTAFGKTVEDEDELVTLAKEVEALEVSPSAATTSEFDMLPAVIAPRPPVVTIMGHVDHGKTSLLDKIRNARVAQQEAGGITQAISAFKVALPRTEDEDEEDGKPREITFIDTPGHAAFSQMRQRGAKMTDIVVLVIAADDGIMEQTKECIQAAKLAQCPIVVAVNKVDKVGANIEKVKQDLLNEGLLLEEYGGEIQLAKVSAKTGEGIDELLEKIVVQADVMALQARIGGGAGVEGTVVEGSVDKGLGVVVTALIQQGTVKVGQTLVCGTSYGKIRLLLNDQGKSVTEAGPSTPVRIIGMNRVPFAGDSIVQAANDNLAKEMSEARLRFTKDQQLASTSAMLRGQSTAGIIGGTMDTREIIKIPIVLKTDVGGSLEAIVQALTLITVEDETAICKLDIVYSGIGDVTTSDVAIAASSKAKLLAFNVAATMSAQDEARSKNVPVQYYSVLYDLLDEMKQVVDTTITPPTPGVLLGKALIKKVFTIGRTGKVAGCVVESGKIVRNAPIRVVRGKTPIYVGVLSSLKIIKEDQEEVTEGEECGLAIKGYEEFEEGDIVESFQVLEDEDN